MASSALPKCAWRLWRVQGVVASTSHHHNVGIIKRSLCSWLRASDRASSYLDIERVFTEPRVQQLLHRISAGGSSRGDTMDAQRIFHEENYYSHEPKAPAIHLMSEEELAEFRGHIGREAERRLQVPPFMNARHTDTSTLAVDDEIAGFDTSPFLFIDVSPLQSHRERVVAVRQPDGLLRTGTSEERARLIRMFYPREHVAVEYPKLFSQPYFNNALDGDKHRHVLDYAAWYFEPDDPDYITICRAVYRHCDRHNKHDLLWCTRHFGALAFYLVIKEHIEHIMLFCCHRQSMSAMAAIVELYNECHDTRKSRADKEPVKTSISFALKSPEPSVDEDIDEETEWQRDYKIVQDFVSKRFSSSHPLTQRLLTMQKNRTRAQRQHAIDDRDRETLLSAATN